MENQQPQCKLNYQITFNDQAQKFVLAFFVLDQLYYQMLLAPDDLKNMSYQMIKIVKDYNLKKAKEFAEQEEKDGRIAIGMENRETPIEGVEGSSEQSEKPE